MTEYEDEDIDEMIDEIFEDEAPKKEYRKVCEDCGKTFAAKAPKTRFCPDCLKTRRSAGGRKGAQKAHGLKPAPAPARAPKPEPKPGPAALEADVEVLADMQAQICRRHGLTFGRLAEAVAALIHYKAVLARLGAESEENKDA